jgi:ubiquinol-cytochrome c reductase iron-sulfur subunit
MTADVKPDDKAPRADAESQAQATVGITVSLSVTIVAAILLAVVYFSGGQNQLEGLLLGLALGGVGVSLVLLAKKFLPQEIVVNAHEDWTEETEDADTVVSDIVEVEGEIGRRKLVTRMFVGALAALGLAAIVPIRSLGPRPTRSSLCETSWRKGSVLVDENGDPVPADEIDVGGTITVFPEDDVGGVDSQGMLLRLDPEDFDLPSDLADMPVDGLIVYSKLCTHVGCPVGLFDKTKKELVCPCHRSTFDVARGGDVVFGPAGRRLPILPIEIDDDGLLRAKGDFTAPVGPGFWSLPSCEATDKSEEET